MLQLLFILLCLHKPCCLSRCPDAYLDVPCSTPSQYPLLICLSPHHSVVTLSRSPTISSVKITDRSFSYASPRLWNQLPDSFRQRLASHVSTHLFIHLSAHYHYLLLSSSPLSSSITSSLFHSRLKTYRFNKSSPP